MGRSKVQEKRKGIQIKAKIKPNIPAVHLPASSFPTSFLWEEWELIEETVTDVEIAFAEETTEETAECDAARDDDRDDDRDAEREEDFFVVDTELIKSLLCTVK